MGFLRAAVLAIIALALAASAGAQEFYFLGKSQHFIQTGAGTVIADSTAPFSFGVSAPKSGLTLTVPGGATYPLVYNSREEEYAMSASFATKAALDAAFPNGTYTISGPGAPTVTIVLTGDLYPVAPQITGGTWNAGGALLLSPTAAATVNFNAFSTYATAGAVGHVYAEFGPLDQQSFSRAIPGVDVPVAAQPLTSLAIPNGTLRNNFAYTGQVEFDTFTTVDSTSVPGAIVVGGLP